MYLLKGVKKVESLSFNCKMYLFAIEVENTGMKNPEIHNEEWPTWQYTKQLLCTYKQAGWCLQDYNITLTV